MQTLKTKALVVWKTWHKLAAKLLRCK